MKTVPLSQGFFALVDDEDFERVNQFKWSASIESRGTRVYAVRRCHKDEPHFRPGKHTKLRMHRWILNLPPLPPPGDWIVDHDNDDGLDNRKENLIMRTQSENMKKVGRWRKIGWKKETDYF